MKKRLTSPGQPIALAREPAVAFALGNQGENWHFSYTP